MTNFYNNEEFTKDRVISSLTNNHDNIVNKLKNVLKEQNFNYKSFGTEIEPYITSILIEILKEDGILKDNTQVHIAKDKNEFPDFVVLSLPKLGLEIKSGNHRKKSNGEWTTCNNSNNDLGTLRSWDDKLSKFPSDNLYYVFIEYIMDDVISDIIDVKIEPFYRFIGINSDGLLKYRKKDGNLRPKNFDAPSPITSLDEFKKLLTPTNISRAKSIIMEYIQLISESDFDKFIEEIKIEYKKNK